MVYEKENKTVCRRAVRDVSYFFFIPLFARAASPFCFSQRKRSIHTESSRFLKKVK